MADLRQTFARTENLIVAPGRLMLPRGPQPGMAVLIRDGRFHRVDSVGRLRAAHPEAAVAELPGHLLMPGFVDTHTHLTQSLGKSLVFGEPSEIFRRIWVPLEGSLDEHMVYLSSKLAALECLRGGFTTAVDAGTRSAGHIGRLVDAARETGLRLVVAQICNDLGGAAQGRFRNLGRMGIARHLAADGAQAEALLGVIAGGAQPAVVEGQRLGARAFQEQLAVVGAFKAACHLAANGIAVQIGAVEQGGRGGIGHGHSDAVRFFGRSVSSLPEAQLIASGEPEIGRASCRERV